MSLGPTRNDLSAEMRQSMVTLLNARLADLIDLQMQVKQAHWNVKGKHFVGLHELFEKLYGQLTDYIDDVAERAVQLGGAAEGLLATVSERTTLTPYPIAGSAREEHVDAIANALAHVGKQVRSAIDTADESGDADTADLFTGISRALDKSTWMVEAQLQ